MKSRNREVNIFNMSLLDILCGALGAFCFLMLVLFPYWKPAGATAADIEKRYQAAMREMEAINKQLEKIPGGGDIKDRLDKVTKDYQDQKNQLDSARKEADGLRMRRPFLVNMGWSTANHRVDLYLRFRGALDKGGKIEPPDAAKVQSSRFIGDEFLSCGSGPCNDIWMVRDVPLGGEYEVYYKFLDANGNPEPAQIVNVFAAQEKGFWLLPTVSIPQPKSVVFVGVLKLTAEEKFVFEPQPEYAADFQERNKARLNPPPPAQK